MFVLVHYYKYTSVTHRIKFTYDHTKLWTPLHSSRTLFLPQKSTNAPCSYTRYLRRECSFRFTTGRHQTIRNRDQRENSRHQGMNCDIRSTSIRTYYTAVPLLLMWNMNMMCATSEYYIYVHVHVHIRICIAMFMFIFHIRSQYHCVRLVCYCCIISHA